LRPARLAVNSSGCQCSPRPEASDSVFAPEQRPCGLPENDPMPAAASFRKALSDKQGAVIRGRSPSRSTDSQTTFQLEGRRKAGPVSVAALNSARATTTQSSRRRGLCASARRVTRFSTCCCASTELRLPGELLLHIGFIAASAFLQDQAPLSPPTRIQIKEPLLRNGPRTRGRVPPPGAGQNTSQASVSTRTRVPSPFGDRVAPLITSASCTAVVRRTPPHSGTERETSKAYAHLKSGIAIRSPPRQSTIGVSLPQRRGFLIAV
jgi:hypothetical protein